MATVHLGPVPHDYQQPRVVYRCFKEPQFADALARGKVWLSTLNACREYENPLQGDSLEATNLYFSGPHMSVDEPNGREIARRSGIYIDEKVRGAVVGHNFSTSYIEDAFIVCTTTVPNADGFNDVFGSYVVEIRKPRFFLHRIATDLRQIMPLQQFGLGPIEYTEPVTVGMSEIHPLGFIKRPIYAEQRDFRFIWLVNQVAHPIKPMLINVPNVSSLCRRIC